MSNLQASTAVAIKTTLDGTNSLYGISLNEANLIKQANDTQPNQVDMGITALQGVQSFAALVTQGLQDGSLVKAGVGNVGGLLSAASLINNINKWNNDVNTLGAPTDATLTGIAGDLSALLAFVGTTDVLGAVAVGGAVTAGSVAITAVGLTAAVGLGIYALATPDGATTLSSYYKDMLGQAQALASSPVGQSGAQLACLSCQSNANAPVATGGSVGPVDPLRAPSSTFVNVDPSGMASLNKGGGLSDIVAVYNQGKPASECISVADLRLANGLTPAMDTSIPAGQLLLVPQKVNGNLMVNYGDVQLNMNPLDGTYQYVINNTATDTTTVYSRTLDTGTGEYTDHVTETNNTSGALLNNTVTTLSADRLTTNITRDLNGDGNIDQIAITDSNQNVTDVQNIQNGVVTATAHIQGAADWTQLGLESQLASQLFLTNSLLAAATNPGASGASLFDMIGLGNANTASMVFQKADQNFAASGGSVAASPVITSDADLLNYVASKTNDGSATFSQSVSRIWSNITNITADPTTLALEDAPLAVRMAQQNPSTLNVLMPCKSSLSPETTSALNSRIPPPPC